jgi:hypothetical protein
VDEIENQTVCVLVCNYNILCNSFITTCKAGDSSCPSDYKTKEKHMWLPMNLIWGQTKMQTWNKQIFYKNRNYYRRSFKGCSKKLEGVDGFKFCTFRMCLPIQHFSLTIPCGSSGTCKPFNLLPLTHKILIPLYMTLELINICNSH